jgi:hypothetical protein
MMNTFGPRNLGGFNIGSSVRASSIPEGMRGGTIAWNTVPPATENTHFLDEREVKVGERCLRYGSILVRITSEGESKNMYGPFDRTADDGRQKLELGNAFILDETICEADTNVSPKLFDGGKVFKARLLVGEETHPTWDEFHAAIRVSLIAD